MYLLRIDYIYRGGPVQRMRTFVISYSLVRKLLLDYQGDDFIVIQVKLEKCV